MFGRRSSDTETSSATSSAATGTPIADAEAVGATAPKGRPTPTRKEAEAARKQAIRVPKDPKAAKAAERERAREARLKQAEALRTGDERYLPARDKGAGKKFARTWIDSRFHLSSFFLPVAVVILVGGIVKLPTSTKLWVQSVEIVLLITMLLSALFTYFMLGRALKKEFPDPVDRKGAAWYGTMRSAMPRRLRQPRPLVKLGGVPVEPKAPKTS